MTSTNDPTPPIQDGSSQNRPWWTYRMLWLVIGGPLVVVVASLVTAVIAIRGQDPVLSRDEAPNTTSIKAGPDSQTPAMQARNHAATSKP